MQVPFDPSDYTWPDEEEDSALDRMQQTIHALMARVDKLEAQCRAYEDRDAKETTQKPCVHCAGHAVLEQKVQCLQKDMAYHRLVRPCALDDLPAATPQNPALDTGSIGRAPSQEDGGKTDLPQSLPFRESSQQAATPRPELLSQSDGDEDPFEYKGKRKRMRTGEAEYRGGPRSYNDNAAADEEDDFQNAQVNPFAVPPPAYQSGPDLQSRRASSQGEAS